ALRSWLYSLARQPGEARAELDRAFDRLGAGPMTALPLLLAVSLGGTPGHAERLRQMGVTAQQSPLGAACQAIAGALEGRLPPSRAHQAIEAVAGPVLGAVMELQLAARLQEPLLSGPGDALARAQAQRLAELILRATVQ